MTRSEDRHRLSLLFELFRADQLNARLVSRALAPTGLRGDDYAVYSYLRFGPMTLTSLAEGTGMPLTTAAGYVKRFEERGHLQRGPNPADGRSQLLSLTPAGRARVFEGTSVFRATVEQVDAVMESEGISPEDMMDQLRLVQSVLEKALEAREESE